MKYTASDGNSIHHDRERVTHFIFHGSPDITIRLGHLYMQYEERIKWAKSLGMQDQSTDQIRQQLVQIRDDIVTDMEFLCVICYVHNLVM